MALTVPSWISRDLAHWNRGIYPVDDPEPVQPPIVAAGIPEPASEVVWWQFARPVANQGATPSCGGWGPARVREYLLGRQYGRDFLPEGTHIDGTPAWQHIRRRDYGGDMDGGMYPAQAFAGSIAVGVWPVGTETPTVAATPEAVSAALRVSPLIACSMVDDGWMQLSPAGEQDESDLPGLKATGHMWVVAGLLHDLATDTWFVSGDTQWGPDYGLKGFFLMSLAKFEATRIAPLYSVVMPAQENEAWRSVTCRGGPRGERIL